MANYKITDNYKTIQGEYPSADEAALAWAENFLITSTSIKAGEVHAQVLEVISLDTGKTYPKEVKARIEFWVAPARSDND